MSIVTTNPLSYGLAALRYGSSSIRPLPRAVSSAVTEGQKRYVRSLYPPNFARLYTPHGVLSGRKPEGGAGPARAVFTGATALAGTDRTDSPYELGQYAVGRPIHGIMAGWGPRLPRFGSLRRAIEAYHSQLQDVPRGRLVNIRHESPVRVWQKESRLTSGLGGALRRGASSTGLTVLSEGRYSWLNRPHRGSGPRGFWAHMKRSKVGA